MSARIAPADALAALAAQADATPFRALFAHGSLSVEIYKPAGEDRQQPHARDELYVVIAGSGDFVCAGERRPFVPGELLFVPAGVAHHFEHFSDDFSTWVVFYGPQGGETA